MMYPLFLVLLSIINLIFAIQGFSYDKKLAPSINMFASGFCAATAMIAYMQNL